MVISTTKALGGQVKTGYVARAKSTKNVENGEQIGDRKAMETLANTKSHGSGYWS